MSDTFKKYFCYNHHYQVIICKACKHCIIPGKAIENHLVRRHQYIPLEVRKQLFVEAKCLTLTCPKNVNTPPANTPLFEELELIENGFKCNREECNHYAGTLASIDSHCKSMHKGWTGSNGVKWTSATIQTFFQGFYIKYDRVLDPC